MNERKKRRPGRTLLILFGIVVTLVIAWYFRACRDIEPVDDSDLRLPPPASIPESDNAVVVLDEQSEILGQLAELLDRVDPGIGLEQSWSERTEELTQIRQGLEACRETWERPGFVPKPTTFFDDLNRLQPLRVLVQCLEADTNARIVAGELDPAVENIDRIRLLAAHCFRDPDSLIMAIFGLAFERTALRLEVALTESDALSAEIIDERLVALRGRPSLRVPFEKALRREYVLLVAGSEEELQSAVEAQGVDWPPPRFLYHPNRTQQWMADGTRQLIAALQKSELPPQPTTPGTLELIVEGNSIGHILVGTLLPSGIGATEKLYELELQLRITELALAVKKHEIQNGELPPSLEAVNSSLPEPIDLSDIVYDREARWLGLTEPDENTRGNPRISLRP